jgi:hypothetical protein
MKKISLVALVLFVTLLSCTKENSDSSTTEQSISTTALPLKVSAYVSDNYPAESIISAVQLTNSDASFIVTLNTLEELAFGEDGSFLGNGEAFHHHHGDSIPDDDSLGGHHGHHGGHHGHPGEHGHTISLDSLPASVASFIAENYPLYTFKHAETDSLCQFGSIYEVILDQSGVTPVKLFFDFIGSYLAKAERVEYTTVPQAISDYITANYPDYEVRHKAELFTLADGSQEFSIYLKASGERKNVILTAEGTFVCER